MGKQNKFTRSLLLLSFIALMNSQLCAQKISIDGFKIGDVVDEKYAQFEIGQYEKDEIGAYYVKLIEDLDDYLLIAFMTSLPCSPVVCPEEFQFFLLKDGIIVNKLEASHGREDSPTWQVLHHTFIQYLEVSHDWFENENGIMDYDVANDSYEGIRLVLLDGELKQLKDLSKTELRIIRNLVFAKYGYVFKSQDLNDRFNNTNWYKPEPNVDINSKLTPKDMELIEHIKKLESKSD